MTKLFHVSDVHFGAEDPDALDWFARCVADEIGVLDRSFNGMALGLRDMVKQLSSEVSNIIAAATIHPVMAVTAPERLAV